MFDSKNLKIGSVFYDIKKRGHAFFDRNKIHQEIDGVDWFRYDKPRCTYELITYTVRGILRKELEGEWEFDDSFDETEYFIHYREDGFLRTTVMAFDRRTDEYFVDKDKALEYVKTLEAEAKEMDKT